MRLVLVPKSSPDWGRDLRENHPAITDVRRVRVENGRLIVDGLYTTSIWEGFLTPPTPELLAWAKEHHFKTIMEDMRK